MSDVGHRSRGMRGPGDSRDRRVAKLAARQYGVVAHRQLVEIGVSGDSIHRRVRAGRLHRVHRGVYAVGHSVIPVSGRWMAAVLACGPEAVLSHRDAAALWGLRASRRRDIDVTVPGRHRAGQRGMTLHRSRRLDPDDRTEMKGIPVTSVARTLLDLAEVVSQRQLQRAIEEAERLRLFDLTAVERLCARSPGRHGLRPLRAAIEEAREPDPVDPSELERLFVDLCRDARLPPPEINVEVAGLQVDALWRDARLVVELDSRAFHDNRAAFEEDRMRDIALQLAGYRPVRITHRRLTRKPKEVVAALREMRAA